MTTATSTVDVIFRLNDYIYIGSDNWFSFFIRINWVALFTLLLIGVLLAFSLNYKWKKNVKNIRIDGFRIGADIISCDISFNKSVQEIAYKIWIELITRKLAMQINEEKDVIVEVYNSWYVSFTEIRNLLKNIPGDSFREASDLIVLTIKVLNNGMRPHLTSWQAKFRKWFDIESKAEIHKDKSPQEIQKCFPEYNSLIEDMKQTNQLMIDFASKLEKIAFDKQI